MQTSIDSGCQRHPLEIKPEPILFYVLINDLRCDPLGDEDVHRQRQDIQSSIGTHGNGSARTVTMRDNCVSTKPNEPSYTLLPKGLSSNTGLEKSLLHELDIVHASHPTCHTHAATLE